ncbi:MAG: hypothetical protein ABSF89_12915 [Acidimicrobiales bacterium]|jgi:hypothetical protein
MSTDDDLNRLSTMPADEALLELAKREPRLLLLAEDVRLGNLGNMPDPEYLSELTRSMSDLSPLRKKFARGQAAREIAALWRGVATVEENLERRVEPLVGPDADTADEILKSIVAYNIVSSHLRSLLPRPTDPLPQFPRRG